MHACLYFISPHAHSMKQLDIVALKMLSTRVNVIPILAKSDSMTVAERSLFKELIRSQLIKYDIKVYPMAYCEEEHERLKEFQESVPYAVVGANKVVQSNGRAVRVREYQWGYVDSNLSYYLTLCTI